MISIQQRSDGRSLLTPGQEAVLRSASDLMAPGALVMLQQGQYGQDARGLGSTTILREMRRRTGGAFLDVQDLLEVTRLRHPRYFEQSLFETVRRAFENEDILYLDRPVLGAGNNYNRAGLGKTVLRYAAQTARTLNKRVVSVGAGMTGAVHVRVPELTVDDYAHMFAQRLGAEAVSKIQFEKVYEFAPRLNGHQLVRICETLRARRVERPTVRDVAEVSAEILGATVDLGAVEALSFSSLIGFEPLLRRLDQAILLPLREPELAKSMGLEAKRGVILHGPPGTGKTSVGRALAHQMKGRFFMIDGQHNHEARGCFYKSTAAIFEMALRSSPSVIFIDDADVILSDPSMQQWGRYLLTKLDGLHSQSAAKVCVMMTAMDLRAIPAALLRSGRLEVWLETTLPDGPQRLAMMQAHIDRLPRPVSADGLEAVIDLTEGFTPADLRALVSDAAGYLTFDKARGRTDHSFVAYMTRAADDMRKHKAMAEAIVRKRGGYQ